MKSVIDSDLSDLSESHDSKKENSGVENSDSEKEDNSDNDILLIPDKVTLYSYFYGIFVLKRLQGINKTLNKTK